MGIFLEEDIGEHTPEKKRNWMCALVHMAITQKGKPTNFSYF